MLYYHSGRCYICINQLLFSRNRQKHISGSIVFKMNIQVKTVFWRFLDIFLICAVGILLYGCSAIPGANLQDQQSVNVEKQLEKRQYLQQLEEEPAKQSEKSPEENEAIGDHYLQRGDINKAFLYYAKSVQGNPDNSGLQYKVGTLLLKRDMYVEAEQAFLKMLSMETKNASACEGLGKAYFGRKEFARAEVEFTKAVTFDPELWQSFNYLGLIYTKQQDIDKALVAYQKALDLTPGNTEIINNLAISYYIQEEYEKTVRLLETAVRQKNTDKRIFNNLAVAYCKLDRYDDALEAFRRGAVSDAVAYNNIGWEYMVNNRHEEAIKAFEKALSLNPRFYERASANLEKARKAQKTSLQQ